MLLRRRVLMIPGLMLAKRALAEPLSALQPGDYGYMHDIYHPFYQQVFGGGHCLCGDGDCRATYWRYTQMGSSIGFDVFVNRAWWPLLKGVYIPDPKTIPNELRNDPAHV